MNVGQGVLAMMKQYNDSPVGDSQWPLWGEENYGISGRRYVYLKLANQTFVYRPETLAATVPSPPLAQKPQATWIPSPNYWGGRDGQQAIAIVIHTMSGTLAGCDSWFKNPASEVSAHYGVGLNGEIHQYVAAYDTAWANGNLEFGNVWVGTPGVNPNKQTISIETEDLGDNDMEVTDALEGSVQKLAMWLVSQYPTIKYLVTHRSISPKSRPNCPGHRWADELPLLADLCRLQLIR